MVECVITGSVQTLWFSLWFSRAPLPVSISLKLNHSLAVAFCLGVVFFCFYLSVTLSLGSHTIRLRRMYESIRDVFVGQIDTESVDAQWRDCEL
jgi:hypothetical protein